MTVTRMFPIIPQHLSGRLAAAEDQLVVRKKKKTLVTVVAAADIPLYSRSAPILVEEIVHSKLDTHKYELRVDESGCLVAKGGRSGGWVRFATISPDCHSCNVIVHQSVNTEHPAVYLQTVRELKTGQELRLWFDEQLLATLSIPFLTPGNIQGEKNYTCHKCRRHFEYPNPLKIHISLECGSLRRVEMWKRLLNPVEFCCKNEVSETDISLEKPKFMISFDLKRFSNSLNQNHIHLDERCMSNPSSFDTSNTVEVSERPSSEPSIGRFSAFKPYLNYQDQNNQPTRQISPSLNYVPSNLIFSSPPFYTSPSFPGAKVQTEERTLMDQQAVEVETLVSNLGKSKQGHLCIYCGKIYSRKYGLKIHIRTHTGFKPLKCKFCLRPFGDPSNLNKHVRLHAEGETPYKCEECGKVLVRRRDLERHIKSRHLQEDCI